ncbi:MAG: InlB B-repeat-containing protein, partial [Clostridiales bacterium]|nr:InlB B-repeat-containing protein [Clostridiales bacterium]
MKKSIWSKISSTVLILSMLLAMLPLTSFLAAAEAIGQAGSLSAIPDLDSVIEESTPDLAEAVAFADGLTLGYGSNGKFLAPIKALDPEAIEIYTAEDLNNIRNGLGDSYVLMNDIDLAAWGQWAPIGDNPTNNNSRFTGTFDGQGHLIKNLTVIGDVGGSVGLFGCAYGATIKNVGMEGTEINIFSATTYVHAGGICGYEFGSGTISNCYNIGEVAASFSFSSTVTVGGICGYSSGTIINCYNTGEISSSSSSSSSSAYAGGICGYSSGTIINCYNTGEISSSSSSSSSAYAGGICGNNYGTIINCYNTGGISSSSSASAYGSAYAGGICGYSYSSSSSYNCYNTGEVTASSASAYGSAYAGGICSYSSSSSSINYCVTLAKRIYAENTVNPVNTRSYLIGYITSSGTKSDNLALEGDVDGDPDDDADRRISSDEAKDQVTYEEELGWDFEDVWQMIPGYDYPQLRGLPPVGPKTTCTVTFLAGENGTIIPDPASEEVAYEGNVSEIPGIEADTGYVFAGWKSSLGGTYDDEAVLLYPITGDITFTAVYTDSANATVIFDCNGGNVGGAGSDYRSGKPGTNFIAPIPLRTGYILDGWLPDLPGDTFGEAGSINKYTAQWVATTNTVTFYPGGNGSMTPPEYSESVPYGGSIKNIPSITAEIGSTFACWISDEGDSVFTEDGLKNYPVTADITFTAQYTEAGKATVIFDYNGGKDKEGKSSGYLTGTQGAPYIIPTPERTGYSLNDDWLPKKPGGFFVEAGDVSAYLAQWTANKYTATFEDDDGSMIVTVADIAYGTAVADGTESIPDDPIKDGYYFLGWSDGAGTYSDVSTYIVTGNVTFTAKYIEVADATVVFDYNGGKDDEGNSSQTIHGKPGDPYDVPAPTRNGHTLNSPISWLSELAEEPSGILGAEGSSITYFAQWTANNYTATFKDENGGTIGTVTDIAYGTKIED